MFNNYIKTAFRNFRKYKLYSFINLCSLSIGIAGCLLVYMYVSNEWSYDRFFRNADQIYRLEHYSGGGGGMNLRYANVNQQANPGSLHTIPGIKHQTRFATLPTIFIEINEKKIAESNIWVADSSFFSTFSFPFLEGDRSSALTEPNSFVITRNIAEKYFESTVNALGQTLNVTFQNASIPVTVTGVVENIPSNSHLQFNGIASSSLYSSLFQTNLSDAYLAYNYLHLEDGQSPEIVERLLSEQSKAVQSQAIDYRLQPITDIHLYSSARYEIGPNSDIRYIYFFISIAVILLIIAGINFTSLSTAQSLQRTKEAGIRKVLGANRGQLVIQFLFETVALSLFVAVTVFLLIYSVLPYFNTLTGISFSFYDFFNPSSIAITLALSTLVGIFAGSYPAIYLASFQPVKTLKGIMPSGKKGANIWKTIVVIQFATTIAMIICTVAIYRQLNFIQTTNLGFEKERVLTASNPLGANINPLKSQLKSIAGVKNVTVSSYIPGVSTTGGTASILASGHTDTLRFNWISVDYNYFDTYNIDITEGRVFSENYSTDSTLAFILNEAAIQELGWESAIGKEISAFSKTGSVIGVTRNFNYLSLHEEIKPIIFLIDKGLYFNFSIKLSSTADISETITQIQDRWQTYLPNTPFTYHFLDDQFDALYKQEQQLGTFFGILTPLILFIACLGLFSLSSFMAAKKRKEIGIRKVHGASLTDILFSFYHNYGKLISLASIIAIPASAFFLLNWLQNFAFKISFPFDAFALGILATTFIAISTVSYECFKAAVTNPVESIRSE